ncbi:hypothetical protein VVD49_08700 [Uliginosibacterium sp. H3]|uniref:Adenylate kinase n=1 Tax=Uliginosibacterium silvisoli TaxID=3114758 RepID=A0ABU6K291_9RHOO|nr:hypothetical protein [Uliginosibacterium sp. H3]
MHRILVIGNAGSGKSTLTASLAANTGLPNTGLDKVVWQAGWGRTPRAERLAQEQAIAAGSAWIVDGVSDLLLDAADTVIFLDYSRRRCFWRVLCRNLPYLFRSRPGLPERCPEILIVPTLVKIIWRFPKNVRPKILAACRSQGKKLFHIRNDRELRDLLSSDSLGFLVKRAQE